MIFAILNFISAVAISGVAAYFSILGLATIFPGSVAAVIVMAGSLEVGKLVGSVWLHKNWSEAPKYIRYYLLIAVVVLSLITSMGIFGFLSKSHIEHDFSSQQNIALIEQKSNQIDRLQSQINQKEFIFVQEDKVIDEFSKDKELKIKTLQDRIAYLRSDKNTVIDDLNDTIKASEKEIDNIRKDRQSIIDSKPFSLPSKLKAFDEKNAEKLSSLSKKIDDMQSTIRSINDSYSNEVANINKQIDEIQNTKYQPVNTDESEDASVEIEQLESKIATLLEEKFDLESKQMKIEAEVGPIKYVSAFLKDFFDIKVDIESSVRVIIIILIFVFDPLAILLLIGAAISWDKARMKSLPPDELKIRKELLEELEDYVSQGGSVKMFLDRYS